MRLGYSDHKGKVDEFCYCIYLPEKELGENSTTEDSSVAQQEGMRVVRRGVKFYNLDAVISIGYRVNSKRGIEFCQLSTKRLNGGRYLRKTT